MRKKFMICTIGLLTLTLSGCVMENIISINKGGSEIFNPPTNIVISGDYTFQDFSREYNSTGCVVTIRYTKKNTNDKEQVNTMDMLYTVKQLCEYMNISEKTAYTLVKRRDFPSFKVGGQFRINITKLSDWIDKESKNCAEK